MPTYRNVTTSRKTIANKVVEPLQDLCSLSYLDENTVELLKISEKPYYNPIILSERIEAKGIKSLVIPKFDNLGKFVEKYSIHFYVESGNVKVNYNCQDNEPGLLLYEGARWNIRCFDRNISTIYLNSNTTYIIYIIMEKL